MGDTILPMTSTTEILSALALGAIVVILLQIERNTSAMAATLTDIDNELTAIEGIDSTLATAVTTTLADLEAKIASSGTTTDFTPELTRLQNIATALSAVQTSATAADPASTPAS